jgi:class 3 adenylate cyclase
MSKVVRVKYVFLDVVGYSKRTRNAQHDIIDVLQKIVGDSVAAHRRPADHIIYLPTGDGMCIALIEVNSPFDIHMRIALSILEHLSRHNADLPEDDQRRFDVRVGVNAGEDIPFRDINERENLAGAGINMAARVMDVADAQQIVVGEAVYKDLRDDDEYADAFVMYEVALKHDQYEPVHQYVPKEPREGLDTRPPSSILRGLKRYDSRGDEKLKKEIRESVGSAEQRVWLLGVTLSDEVDLKSLMESLGGKVREKDVRILLLDALRSPALFRAFLETRTDTREFKDLVNKTRHRPRPNSSDDDEGLDDLYYHQAIYSSFEFTNRSLRSALAQNPEFKKAIRYYAHTPLCWLMVIDDTAYYQPYTFGRDKNSDRKSLTIGDQMPVFKVQRETNAHMFAVLEDHFDKLWLTSDSDMFHMGARIADRDRLLYLIFHNRHYWFKTVGAVLKYGEDRRAYPRQPCTSTGNIVTIAWETPGAEEAAKVGGTIEDFSWVSVRLALAEKTLPEVGTVVRMEIIPAKPAVRAARYLFHELLRPTNNMFQVVRVDEEHSEVALWAVSH